MRIAAEGYSAARSQRLFVLPRMMMLGATANSYHCCHRTHTYSPRAQPSFGSG